MTWQGKRRTRKEICSWCGTKYTIPANAQVDTYLTADGRPPAHVGVYADALLVHECAKGVAR